MRGNVDGACHKLSALILSLFPLSSNAKPKIHRNFITEIQFFMTQLLGQ